MESQAALHPVPAFVGEVGDGAMIDMVIDEPFIEYRFRILGGQHLLECFIMRIVDNGMAVRLAGPHRACLQDLPGLLSLGGDPNRGCGFHAPSFR